LPQNFDFFVQSFFAHFVQECIVQDKSDWVSLRSNGRIRQEIAGTDANVSILEVIL